METFTLQPVGHVRGGRTAAEDDDWAESRCRIELDPTVVTDEATLGLEAFSHVEVVFLFDGVDADAVCTGARHPRGNTEWPRVGILAQRAKDRRTGSAPRCARWSARPGSRSRSRDSTRSTARRCST
jgi:tRNA (Thr-GGU) A37 N-methylase